MLLYKYLNTESNSQTMQHNQLFFCFMFVVVKLLTNTYANAGFDMNSQVNMRWRQSTKKLQWGQNNKKYVPCNQLPNAMQAVNNNSISTAIPDNNNIFIAVSQKPTQIYKFPIKKTTTPTLYNEPNNLRPNSANTAPFAASHASKLTATPFQLLKQCEGTSAVDFTQNGKYLAVGCANQNVNVYMFDGQRYVFKQGFKNSYYKNGAKLGFSADGKYLVSIASLKEVYVWGFRNQGYQLVQKIAVNVLLPTMFAITNNGSYFAIFQRGTGSQLQISLYKLNPSNSTYSLASTQSLTRLITSLSLTQQFLSITIGTLTSSPCSTTIYKIDPSSHSLTEFQQIFQTDTKLCITSSTLTQRRQLILTNYYLSSFVYAWDLEKARFDKKYDMYHEALGEPMHTKVNLEGRDYEHLLLYTGVEFNLYCYREETVITIEDELLME